MNKYFSFLAQGRLHMHNRMSFESTSKSPDESSQNSNPMMKEDKVNGDDDKFKSPKCPVNGKSTPPSKVKMASVLDRTSSEYLMRRSRNNISVKRSREKNKKQTEGASKQIESLTKENEALEATIEGLNENLKVLKKVFMDHAKGLSGSSTSDLPDIKELEKLLGHKLTEKSPETEEAGCSSSSSKT